MFFVLLILGSAFIGTTAARKGPRAAAAVAFALAVLLPCFTYATVGAVNIDVRTALALVGIGCVVLHPQSELRPKFLLADALVIGLVASIIATESMTGAATLTVAFDIAIGWLVPYWLGRIVLRDADDVDRLIDAVAPICFALAAWAAVESILRVNPIAALFGHVGSSQSMYDLRWGLRRAEGPLTHPIFFGLQLVLLFPFALAAARKAREVGPMWRRRLPWIVAAGAFFTMSRGPQLGILMTLAATTALLVPRWRAWIVAPIVLVALIGFTAGDLVLDLLHRWSGETPTTLLIDGEPVKYTGTTHRLLQVRVYAEAVANAGWLGYGSTALRAGQSTIPYVDDDLRQMFSSIDNHYLQFALQCGFLGIGLFVGLCATSISYAWRAAAHSDGAPRVLAAAVGGALLSVTLLVSSVWLASDFRFPLLAVMGLAGGLCLVYRSAGSTAVEPVPTQSFAFRLSPGHPATLAR